MNIIIMYSLLLLTTATAVLCAPTDDSSVLVESPPLYIHRMPQRRSKMNNLDARPQVPDVSSSNASVFSSDVEVSEMASGEVHQGGFRELAMTPGTRQFYLVLAITLSLSACILTVLLWWFCCRPKPVPRRFNPRYDGAPPKRLSKLSFRALRYSMTGNQHLKSNAYRASEAHMEPSQPVSTVSAVSTR